MCGVTGRNAEDLMRTVRQMHRFRAQPINSPRFELFATEDSLTQWVFTRPSEPAFPAVSCRHVYRKKEGGFSLARDLRCDASREACDRLFIELRDLDNLAREAINGGQAK